MPKVADLTSRVNITEFEANSPVFSIGCLLLARGRCYGALFWWICGAITQAIVALNFSKEVPVFRGKENVFLL